MNEENFTEEEARKFLQELHDKEKKIIEANQGRAGRSEGIKRLLTQLYPDKAHFIYELLQNAEDARATGVSFNLQREGLIVSHDGLQLFNSKNVDAITNIDTTKREDVNQIGKFGIGFKAVYSYTSRPRIYSGPFKFEIRELFCPFPLYDVPDPFSLNPKHTYFIFPFPGEKKTPEKCFEEIEAGLRALDERAILFLNNIQHISWRIAGGNGGSVARPKTEGNVVKIEKCSNGKSLPESVWLKFDREFARAETELLRCSVAFALQSKTETTGKSEKSATLPQQWEIIPVTGQAHIYFPAAKETTGFKFHVHAPFAAPVDRASVSDSEENQLLIEELGTLIAERLYSIRDAGLLNRSFLAVLPNQGDGVPIFWAPIFKSVIQAFADDALLPTADGGFARSGVSMRGEKAIRDVILAEDLCFLTGQEELVWTVGISVEDKRESAFLDALGLDKFSWKELVDALGQKCRRYWHCPDFEHAETWLKSKDVKWLGRFYALLDKAADETRHARGVSQELAQATILLLSDGSYTEGSSKPFFSPTMRLPKGLSFQTVNGSIFDNITEKQAESARSFLRKVGVKDVNDDEVVENLLETFYGDDATEIPDTHLQHIKLFMDWSAKSKKFDAFKDARIFRNMDGELSSPNSIYIDSPFANTRLSALFTSAGEMDCPRYPLWSGYSEKFETEVIAKFAIQTGAIFKLLIECVSIGYNNPEYSRLYNGWGHVRRTSTEKNTDYWIANLDAWLGSPSLKTSQLIWEAMAAADPETFLARYYPNADYDEKERTAPSRLIATLKRTRWLPSREGNFQRPANLTEETLHPEFKYDNRNRWLDAIGFGSAAKASEAEVVARKEAAERIGQAPELAEEIRSLSDEQQKELLDLVKGMKRRGSDFPKDESPNSELRAKRAEEQAKRARSVQRETRARTVRTTSDRDDVRNYLSQRYTEDDCLFCQMSQEPVPFAVPSGEPYFVAVEILPLGKEISANHLCLSPTCAAEFRYALLTDNDTLRSRILKAGSAANQTLEVEIEVPLSQHRKIRFTQKHLIDLQAAIRACGR